MYVSVKKIKNYKISVKAIVVKILENKKILSQKLGFSKNSRYLKKKKKDLRYWRKYLKSHNKYS